MINIDFERILDFSRRNNVGIDLFFEPRSPYSMVVTMTNYTLKANRAPKYKRRRDVTQNDLTRSHGTPTDILIWTMEMMLADMEENNDTD